MKKKFQGITEGQASNHLGYLERFFSHRRVRYRQPTIITLTYSEHCNVTKSWPATIPIHLH